MRAQHQQQDASHAGPLHPHVAHRASAATTSGWLEERVAQCRKELFAWRKEAFDAGEQALAAYERTRSQPESVVPQEEL